MHFVRNMISVFKSLQIISTDSLNFILFIKSSRCKMDERMKFYDLFNNIDNAVNKGGQIAEILVEGQHRDQFGRFGELLTRLAGLDRELDTDRKAVDETLRQHENEVTDKRVLAKHFKTLRKNMVLPDAGRHQKDIVAVQQKLKIALQEPAAGSKDKGNTQHDESQPEMELIETVMSAKDPITKRDIQDPVKNTICQHIYDRNSVQQYIDECRQRRQLCQCPVRLCGNKKLLQMAQMVPYPEFFKLIRQQRSRSRSKSREPGPSSRAF